MRMALSGLGVWWVDAAVYFHMQSHSDIQLAPHGEKGGLRHQLPGATAVEGDLILDDDDSAIEPYGRKAPYPSVADIV